MGDLDKMTEKQFTLTMMSRYGHLTGISDGEKEFTTNEIVDLLNELHEENQQLRDEIQDFQNLLTEREETFLKPIRLALDDAIENERTHIGRNVLKQFKQTINGVNNYE